MSFAIHQGDALTVLRTLPCESVHCCITSPPYWGLRDYGTGVWEGGRPGCDHKRKNVRPDHSGRTISGKGLQASAVSSATPYKDACRDCGAQRNDQQLGLERTPEEYIGRMVDVFREVRRVLRGDGTLWVNIGDTYVGGGNGGGGSFAKDGIRAAEPGTDKNLATRHGRRGAVGGLKPKDLVGIPWALAFALRGDGWYLRSDIIWSKPNPMPESVTDRPTKSHEYLFLLSKSARYFYQREAVMEPLSTRPGENYPARARVLPRGGQAFAEARGNDRGKSGGFPPSYKGSSFTNGKSAHGKSDVGQGDRNEHAGRNKRSVWTLATLETPDAHFATFPIELPETCLLAGCPEGGTVFDPFAGAGTTGLAALKNGRRFLGIELNPEYIKIAYGRVEKYYPLLGGLRESTEPQQATAALDTERSAPSSTGQSQEGKPVMGETRTAKRQRLEKEADRMRNENTMPESQRNSIESQEAYRQGWNDWVSGRIGSRDLSPLKDPRLRQIWRNGFDSAQRGLKVKLPPVVRPVARTERPQDPPHPELSVPQQLSTGQTKGV